MDQYDSPLRALREGRISASTAARWVEMEQQADERDARIVRAHSRQQAHDQLAPRLHSALDLVLHPPEDDEDLTGEFNKLFPPTDPINRTSDLTWPRTPKIQQGDGARASAADDDDPAEWDFQARLARCYPPRSPDDVDEQEYVDDYRVAASRGLTDDELHDLLFPKPYTRRPVDDE